MVRALRFVIWAYLLFLAIIAVWGVAAFVAASAPWTVVAAEVVVDAIVMAGVVLFLLGSRVPAWRWVLVLALAGQSAILSFDPPETSSDTLLMLGVLAPALVMNVLVAWPRTPAPAAETS